MYQQFRKYVMHPSPLIVAAGSKNGVGRIRVHQPRSQIEMRLP
jgi:hypothetical protein